jgi:hypothetical protein
MLALDGRCKTLDRAADGYVRGEACIATYVVAGPTSKAAAVVCLAGTCVNHDGRSSSLTAPNGPSQQQVCLECSESRVCLTCDHRKPSRAGCAEQNSAWQNLIKCRRSTTVHAIS